MFALPPIAALFTFIYLRPHEVFPALRAVTFPAITLAVALGFVIDAKLGITRARASTMLGVAVAFFGFCLVTVVLRAPDQLGGHTVVLFASFVGFVVMAEAIPSLRALGVVASIIVVLTVALSVIGVQQGLASPICYVRGGDENSNSTEGEKLDGRPCVDDESCLEGGAPGAEYLCESPGPFGTHTIEQRVRFRGVLEDPNELSMAIALGLPLAFCLYQRRRSAARLVAVLLATALIFTCVIMTKSRSGQLAVLAALGVYFVRRFGKKGIVIAAIVGVPLVLLGGRSGAEADSSSSERLECWAEAIGLWREHPLGGVGQGEFLQYHYLTAHNSFLLTLAEMGPVGIILWTAALYAAFKAMVRIQIDFADRPDAAGARSWATALSASLAGLAVSSLFLSVAYHVVVWIFLGLAAALYGIVRRHAPSWRVRYGLGDAVLVVMADVVLVGGIMGYLRFKGV